MVTFELKTLINAYVACVVYIDGIKQYNGKVTLDEMSRFHFPVNSKLVKFNKNIRDKADTKKNNLIEALEL